MKKTILYFTLILFSFTIKAQDDFFTNAGRFFNKYVQEGLVDYNSIIKYPASLDALIQQIGQTNLKGMNANTKKAFLINSYNLLVIKTLVKKQPLNNPTELAGFFDKIKHNVGGNQWTLNYIENNQIRKVYNDPRIHFVLVCGALGCPKIANYAYTPDRLESKLEQLTRLAINNKAFIRVNNTEKKVLISELFYWYKDDFLSQSASLLDYINKYRAKKIPDNFKVDKYPYDWTWNNKKK